jgi:hypothetical protein
MELARLSLQRLLDRWEVGEITERQVHEQAEAWWDAQEWPILPETDPRSIQLEVLSVLDSLNVQWVTKEDIPAIRHFLRTPVGGESVGWKTWRRYWDGVDFEKRKTELAGTYYSA